MDKKSNNQQIISHEELVKGDYYWVFLDGKWNPTMVYAPFKPDDLYFRFLNGMHKSCREVKTENIEKLSHNSVGMDS